VLAHTRALYQCELQGQATAASTEQAANLRWLTQEPRTKASHKGKQQLPAQSKQLTCADSHKSPAPMQVTKASDSCKHIASFKPVLAHTGALHQCKPQITSDKNCKSIGQDAPTGNVLPLPEALQCQQMQSCKTCQLIDFTL